tara:strand:- start:400 stop:1104 length:705 start_codon:yes stop_codon:yes gene_type:complete
MRPWHKYKISECNEPLIPIPPEISRFVPHPYLSLGAPYGNDIDPWKLRVDVVRRLQLAQRFLQIEDPTLRLLVFDAWRPIRVQEFMISYSIAQECYSRGINPHKSSSHVALQEIKDKVAKFWASPSLDPCTPPPHSTGAAVDLTFVTDKGEVLDMGGKIDEIGDISNPDYYAKPLHEIDSSISLRFHSRRNLLQTMMKKAGFSQHPNEWWHFSFGDQMWAWRSRSCEAIYGLCE